MATMGKGAGNGGVYDPRQKENSKKGKTGYWPSVQADLNKQSGVKGAGTPKTKSVGR